MSKKAPTKLTQRLVDQITLGSGYVADDQVKGLMLLAHHSKKTFTRTRTLSENAAYDS